MGMKALIDSSGECFAIVYTTDGYDLTGVTIIDPVPEPERDYVWNKATQAFVPRPPTDAEKTRSDLGADPRWAALKNATGAEIDTWLQNNVTSLAQARQVLGLLLRAVRVLAADKRFD